MSTAKNLFKFFKVGSKVENKGMIKDMMNSILTESKTAGSINFFLNGKAIQKDEKTGKVRLISKERRRNSISATSVLNNLKSVKLDKEKVGLRVIDDSISVTKILFQKSFQKLYRKLLELCQDNKSIPKPTITYCIKDTYFIVEIPLLCTSMLQDLLLKDIKITDGKLYIQKWEDSKFDDIKLILETPEYVSNSDIDVILYVYEQSYKLVSHTTTIHKNHIGKFFAKNLENIPMFGEVTTVSKELEKQGCIVHIPEQDSKLDWNILSGYDDIKRDIEDTISFSFTHPEVYSEITQNTRSKYEDNRPKFVLFEGPPGCGKTTSAKIIGQTVNIPLVYLPLEAVLSKYYGDSESKLAKIFETCQELSQWILFIDEIDSLGMTRDSNLHEATRRILSTLLRKLDSFESFSNILVIWATNRKQDLDSALVSRLDVSIKFNLPDTKTRFQIFKQYAKQLVNKQLKKLSEISEGLSGRDIFDICRDAERKWGGKFIRKEVKSLTPDEDIYVQCTSSRIEQIHNRVPMKN